MIRPPARQRMTWQGSCTILRRPRRPPGPSSRTSRPRACAPPSNLGCPRRALHRLKAVKARPAWLAAAWGACGCRDGGRLGVGASGRRLERRPRTAGADHVPRTRSATSGSAGPAKRGAALSRKLLAAVLTLVLAGWLLQGCGPSGGEMTPATASTWQRDVDAVVSAADSSRYRRTGSIRGRRGERPSYRPTVRRARRADPRRQAKGC
jgi:hypothetical protein